MNRPANGRAHLSIGEVLSLLQDEFPDVTISKIRFLESQGLLDPERTPSGYRKFYNADIERLRWILRQQKDHYLPLKVIKDRLDQAGGTIPADDDVSTDGQQRLPDTGEVDADEVEDRSRAEGRYRPAHLAEAGSGQYRNGSPVAAVETRPAAAPAGPPERWRDGLWPDAAVDGQPAEATRPKLLPAPPPRPEPLLSRPEAASAPPAPATQPGSPASGLPTPPAQAEVNGAAAPMAPPDRPSPTRRQEPRRQEPRRPQRRSAQAETGPSPPSAAVAAGPGGDMADVSLSLEELAEASGLSPRDIRDLEAFGLIEPYDADDPPVYDGDALVVAHTAAGFLQHGIEPRHLRTYKVAMDREAGLFEQIVLPILKQRNPEARRRAARTVTELIRLGEVMRGVLLRRELRDHLAGGR